MTAANAIRDLIAPMLPDWSLQFAHWTDPGARKRSAVIKPVGGGAAERVRRPQFTLTLIGGEPADREIVGGIAEQVVEAIRNASGELVYLSASEPAYSPTADGRPVFEIALGAITT